MPIEPEILTKEETEVETETMVAEEGQTIVHCICMMEAAYRIWPSTYLIEQGGKKAKLITAYNVTFYPYWTLKNPGQKFTLIFEGLSKGCAVFDLKEEIPQEGGFYVKGILRNGSDVYTVEIG
jgi:3-polyprenyl-4-hydroxybenzoate decarboxylase